MKSLWPAVALVAALVCVGFVATSLTAQSRSAAPGRGKTSRLPKTAWGDPDIGGLWSNATVTPIERPSELAGKETLSAEEAADFEQKTIESRNHDRRDDAVVGRVNGAPETADVARAYNEFWWDQGTKVVSTRRTSLVIDPPDGRIPALTSEGKERAAAVAGRRERPAEGPEDRTALERCITRGLPLGMMPGPYNNNYRVVQSPGYVMILAERVHDARIIPLDRPHVGPRITQWLGDSRGRWDGDTLVVDTTNFAPSVEFRGSTSGLHVVERFTRTDAETMQYQITMTDPTTWVKPWTLEMSLTSTEGPLYEYACHEGNYGMTGILSGARAIEKQSAKP